MSKYEELPVYKAALDLAVYFEKTVRHYERYNKYTLGADFRKLSLRICVLLAKANIKETRQVYLEEALNKLLELKIIIHIANGAKVFRSFKNFEFVVKSVSEIARQCEGWKKASIS